LCYISAMFKSKQIIFSVSLIFITLISIINSGCPSQGTGTENIPNGSQAAGNLNLYNIDPYTLDPAASSESTSHEYIFQIFTGLVQLDDNLNPVPDIAESWTDENGTVYTFKLRHDVTFHDGRGVKAADFKYSWERACAPETGSTTAKTYLGDIVGVQDVLDGKTREISGVKVIDDYTLQVTIDAPKPYFLYKVGYVTAFVVDRNNVAQGNFWWRSPNGTGPFKLKEWKQGESLVLEQNPVFYGEKAKLATVTFKILSGVPMNLYETGEIDVTDVSLAYIDMATDEEGDYYKELSIHPELSFYYFGFNGAKPPFDDVNIRRAFSMAIDKTKIASLVYKDMVEPAGGILPPGIPGYNTDLKGLEFNIEAAKQLIKTSKYGSVDNLPPITITTAGYGPTISSTIEAVVHDWKQNLGVDVKVRVLDPQRFFYTLKQEKDEMFDIGWIADYPYPQNFLEILFHSGLDNNWGEYSSRDVDAILDRAGVEPDNAKALKLYQQAEQMIVDDAACLPISFGKGYILTKPDVAGYKPTPMGIVRLNKVSIASP
jgi:oligopeptide transport system substrate-binding protein